MGFKESLSNGTIGEFVVWNYFSKLPTIKTVVDVRDDSFFQSVDVDFLFENVNRQYVWVEVKTDYQAHRTGNFVYEVSTSGNIGCFEKTKAQYIAYYVPQSGKIYLIHAKGLKAYTKENKLRKISMGDNAQGYLLDIGELEKAGIIKGMYQAEITKGE